jgi:hypothetical protein
MYKGGYGLFLNYGTPVDLEGVTFKAFKEASGISPRPGDDLLKVTSFTSKVFTGMWVVDAVTHFKADGVVVMSSFQPPVNTLPFSDMGVPTFYVVKTGTSLAEDIISEVREAIKNDDGSDPPVRVCTRCTYPRAWDQGNRCDMCPLGDWKCNQCPSGFLRTVTKCVGCYRWVCGDHLVECQNCASPGCRKCVSSKGCKMCMVNLAGSGSNSDE